MERYIVNLGTINHEVEVQILRKNIKGINLKVYRNCTVKLSLPMYIPDEWVAKFLEKKKKWIDTQITK